MNMKIIFAHLIFLISFSAQASWPDYYTVEESESLRSHHSDPSLNPMEALNGLAEEARAKILDFNLLSWTHHNEELADPEVPYDRKSQYGTWVRDPREKNCYNTRARVLIRSSEIPVSFSTNGCTVVSGQWHDPYSDSEFTQASDLQIDHVVPLKNSYVSGAWKWDGAKRCLYGNFMSNEFHLLAVNGHDNMKKGDRTPEEFMPPNEAYACTYLTIWLKIKLIWNLAMTPSEAQAISQLVKQNNCDESLLVMTSEDLNHQRESILENMTLCQ
ncbi:MAG: HNH endonuclease family protein [Pseudobdellovibrionaceae bacterium]